MIKAPCKDCADRDIGCHSGCFDYNNYKRNHYHEESARREEQRIQNDYVSFQIERREHARRAHHKPK